MVDTFAKSCQNFELLSLIYEGLSYYPKSIELKDKTGTYCGYRNLIRGMIYVVNTTPGLSEILRNFLALSIIAHTESACRVDPL